MRILVQIENGNQKLFTAIKALLNAQPNLKFKIDKVNIFGQEFVKKKKIILN